ncbi:hypothetical protein [Amycolatopsis cihanbeyliensis]|uniref:PE family protein n=1 Tax=Amycolatopsis cihanbeyliensis TaxID=1128664 RepID=A0A542DLA3_AMYCI|nr:hypothetical protein [Amycolatopsis cihanbeyliensis]TQJ03881.1 hypothetical protein FB471_3655 [Amycolatopsis cihanbeyliensis]
MTAWFEQPIANARMSAGTGGGYRFDADGAQKTINDIYAVLEEELYPAKQDAERLTRVEKPGDEVASEGYVHTANSSGQSYLSFLDAAIRYLEGYAEGLERSRQAYLEQEGNAAEAMRGKDG